MKPGALDEEMDDDFDGDYRENNFESQLHDNLKNAFAKGRKIVHENDMEDVNDFQSTAQMYAQSSMLQQDQVLGIKDFDLLLVLGQGMVGKVFLAQLKSDKSRYFAIKCMRKDKLIDYEMVEKAEVEKDILFNVDHPFLCGMDYLFQTELRLFFVMPFIRGGELFKVLQNNQRFDEKVVKFYAV